MPQVRVQGDLFGLCWMLKARLSTSSKQYRTFRHDTLAEFMAQELYESFDADAPDGERRSRSCSRPPPTCRPSPI